MLLLESLRSGSLLDLQAQYQSGSLHYPAAKLNVCDPLLLLLLPTNFKFEGEYVSSKLAIVVLPFLQMFTQVANLVCTGVVMTKMRRIETKHMMRRHGFVGS